ncbi:hypothetical protein GUITHDRAFT_117714 [Guillardia theta CCMP2712]|uniref:Uncharacterized protein n=1 Tax=Guillardia theta (strain CCMP2712) TaxID=905079 RepID=L1IJA1_GUITC|nr:hypothetical protein GUITHDRAFT_117714 [Guillardia theta CCMP2712]EKX36192.1 hypothetical protein GUITHDRAFT_117714 [Guillardia theta CCMP2712]|eukprot:XP_005823172.1 hypothetical protein GUITHDRAFT_117714 [Guillardia theta CCMP2712]
MMSNGKRNLARVWSDVAMGELSVLTCLCGLAFIMQYSVFFMLMFKQPGIRDFNAPYCESLHYISDKLAMDKGVASLMVISGVLSWVVIGVISARQDTWVNRGIFGWLATVGYAGTVAVVLFNNTSNNGDIHLAGAGVLAVSYIIAQIILSLIYFAEKSISKISKWSALALSFACLCFLLAYIIVYFTMVYLNSPCRSTVVILEYVVYLITSLNNVIVYVAFTANHTRKKIDFYDRRNGNIGMDFVPVVHPKVELERLIY